MLHVVEDQSLHSGEGILAEDQLLQHREAAEVHLRRSVKAVLSHDNSAGKVGDGIHGRVLKRRRLVHGILLKCNGKCVSGNAGIIRARLVLAHRQSQVHGFTRRHVTLNDPIAIHVRRGLLVTRHKSVESGLVHGAAQHHVLRLRAHVLHEEQTQQIDGKKRHHRDLLRNILAHVFVHQIHQATTIRSHGTHCVEEEAVALFDGAQVAAGSNHLRSLLRAHQTLSLQTVVNLVHRDTLAIINLRRVQSILRRVAITYKFR